MLSLETADLAPVWDEPPPSFTFTVDDDGLATLVLDVPGATQNVLTRALLDELDGVLDRLERDRAITGVVLASGKPKSFLAGADVGMLAAVATASEGEALSRAGQRALDRLATLPVPVVAAIQGPCLGGGLEVALACRARVAADDPTTALGLPEVLLGLVPGAGGTQRLPRLIGLSAALDLLLTGRHVPARRALALGLVDEAAPPAIVRDAAARLARRLAAGGLAASRGVRARLDLARLRALALDANPLGRAYVLHRARSRVLARTRGHYPAPLRLLEVVGTGLAHGARAGLGAEACAFGELVVDPVTRSLIGLFTAQTAAKKDPGTAGADAAPRPLRKLVVLGGGLMGGGIAHAVAGVAGLPVRIRERDDAGVARALGHVRGLVEDKVARGSLARRDADALLGRVTATTDARGLGGADLVIEAVLEDLELKRRLLREVEAVARPDTIFASNTSTIPIARLAEASSRPETVVGMHFFSPVHRMPLLEVVVTDRTAPWVTATAVAAGKALGKTPIVVRDGPGFYTSRILAPYLAEAAHLLLEGVPIEAIDAAAVAWGFPVGPLALVDEIGLDVAARAAGVLHAAFGDRLGAPAPFELLLAQGRAGRKSGKGLYRHDPEGKRPDPEVARLLGAPRARRVPPAHELARRLVLRMATEAVRCLDEEILRSPADGDLGAVLGLGFPPFRGGPFRWIDAEGAERIVRELERLTARHGVRFEPPARLLDRARNPFHRAP